MGILDGLAKVASESPIGAIAGVISEVIGRVLPDPEQAKQAEQHAFEVLTSGTFAERSEQALALAQIDVNKAEAQAPGVFKGGWRPGAGWVCVAGLGVDFIVRPLLPWAIHVTTGNTIEPIPPLDTATLLTLLAGLLGLSKLRTTERLQGKA